MVNRSCPVLSELTSDLRERHTVIHKYPEVALRLGHKLDEVLLHGSPDDFNPPTQEMSRLTTGRPGEGIAKGASIQAGPFVNSLALLYDFYFWRLRLSSMANPPRPSTIKVAGSGITSNISFGRWLTVAASLLCQVV